jgi:protein ImuB
MLWLALHLPALSLESWAALRGCGGDAVAEPAARPLALLQDHQVLQADALARACGVRPGMTRATALALAPDLLWAAADLRRDMQALRAVADVALGFSPAVAWATPAPWRPAAATAATSGAANPVANPALVGVRLEVQSCLRYFGGLPALLQRLRGQLAPLGHRVHIASAPTALGAALLAAWRDDLAFGAHSSSAAALQPLLDAVPLPLLGPGLLHWQALQGMGLATLGDLASLPRSGLARRFGPELLADIDRARGQLPEAHTWLGLPPRFASRLELLARADTSAQVLAGARLLLARLVAWAQARQGRIVRFTLVMHHEPRHRPLPDGSEAPSHTPLVIAPAQPSADAAHLHSLLAERLGRLPLPAPALELSLRCDALAALPPPNAELFANRSSQREGLGRLVERLQARLGRDQVLCLSAVADHRPEHATRWHSADAAQLAGAGAGAAALARHTGAASATAAGPGARPAVPAALATQPLWLLPQPQALAERGRQPLLQGRPLQLLAGPERLETGWWDGPPALRDYFIAQAASGALVWVYCTRAPRDDAAAPGWFLQGLFA